MRALIAVAATLSLIGLGASAAAKPADKAAAGQNAKVLQQGLSAVMAGTSSTRAGQGKATATGQSAGSQGSAHASDNAFDHVCSHDNPSATRSAICRAASPF